VFIEYRIGLKLVANSLNFVIFHYIFCIKIPLGQALVCRVERRFIAVSLNVFCFNIFRCVDETPGGISAGK
jgi:hypothetical protein